jgi:hypothetical protein
MGWTDEHDEAQKPLEGEIVLPTRRASAGGYRTRQGNLFDDDLVQEVIAERVVKRRTLRSIADEYGVSTETIARWAGERNAMHPTIDVGRARALLADELDVIAQEAWKIHRETLDRKLQLDALGRLESLVRSKAQLLGLNAPVRHDVTLSAVTEAERELQEIINEAKAKTAAQEQAVIDAASTDPDL